MGSDPRQAEYDARVGSVLLGKWTLERLLGAGGMAAVYAARHRIGTEVAIKILHPEVARSRELCERFDREARIMAQLKHPGAVQVHDVEKTDDGLPFMVMELLRGESLKQRFERAAITLDDLLRFSDEILDVLDAAHKQGIIHRDIKLDNVFIQDSGALKVLDFGIARTAEGRGMTMMGAMLGTLPYMPPEQVRGAPIDARADLFALGAVMFRAVARRRVHEAADEAELIAKMSGEPAPPLAAVAPHAPPGVSLVTDRALAFDREHRYPSAAIMQEDVKSLRRGESPAHAERLMARTGPPNARGHVAIVTPAVTWHTRAATPDALEAGRASPSAPTVVPTQPLPVSDTAAATPFAPTAAIAAVSSATVRATPFAVSSTLPAVAAVTAHGAEGTLVSGGIAAAITAPAAAPAAAAGWHPGETRAAVNPRRNPLWAVVTIGALLFGAIAWRCVGGEARAVTAAPSSSASEPPKTVSTPSATKRIANMAATTAASALPDHGEVTPIARPSPAATATSSAPTAPAATTASAPRPSRNPQVPSPPAVAPSPPPPTAPAPPPPPHGQDEGDQENKPKKKAKEKMNGGSDD